MNLKNKLLFEFDKPVELGLGYHNIGNGVLRYANEEVKNRVGSIYAQRCGHIPFNAKTIGILVEELNDDIRSHVSYLEKLYGRKLTIVTPADLKKADKNTMVVPFITVPEAEETLRSTHIWGLPSKMTHVLKNKSEFYRLVNKLQIEDFNVPEYTTSYLEELIPHTKAFLLQIKEQYLAVGLQDTYPLGVMLRAADEDGNYGCAMLYEKGKYVVMIPNGEVDNAKVYGNWEEALVLAKRILSDAMQIKKEPRVVLSRYIDTLDSPGMTIIILNGTVHSLGWNEQQAKEPSRTPIAAGTYKPTNPQLQELQKQYEAYTAEVFEKFLRAVAEKCKIDFASVTGIANLDIIIPAANEIAYQKKLGKKPGFYYSECNPRWTTYTDAIMTILGIQQKPQTINNMLQVIKEGIAVVDKYKLPRHVEPALVRELILKKDKELQAKGTRIICRMTSNPLGVIYYGDINLAQAEMKNIVREVSQQYFQSPTKFLIA